MSPRRNWKDLPVTMQKNLAKKGQLCGLFAAETGLPLPTDVEPVEMIPVEVRLDQFKLSYTNNSPAHLCLDSAMPRHLGPLVLMHDRQHEKAGKAMQRGKTSSFPTFSRDVPEHPVEALCALREFVAPVGVRLSS